MTEVEPLVSSVKEEADLIAWLVVNSFRLSRGNGMLQNILLAHAGQTYTGSLSDEAFKVAHPQIYSRCAKARLSSAHVDTPQNDEDRLEELDAISEEVDMRTFNLHVAANGIVKPIRADAIISRVLEADTRWLRDGPKAAQYGMTNRSYKSNFVKYGLIGAATGDAAFDQVYTSAVEQLPLYLYSGDVSKPYMRARYENFGAICTAHLKDNPGSEDVLLPLADRLGLT